MTNEVPQIHNHYLGTSLDENVSCRQQNAAFTIINPLKAWKAEKHQPVKGTIEFIYSRKKNGVETIKTKSLSDFQIDLKFLASLASLQSCFNKQKEHQSLEKADYEEQYNVKLAIDVHSIGYFKADYLTNHMDDEGSVQPTRLFIEEFLNFEKLGEEEQYDAFQRMINRYPYLYHPSRYMGRMTIKGEIKQIISYSSEGVSTSKSNSSAGVNGGKTWLKPVNFQGKASSESSKQTSQANSLHQNGSEISTCEESLGLDNVAGAAFLPIKSNNERSAPTFLHEMMYELIIKKRKNLSTDLQKELPSNFRLYLIMIRFIKCLLQYIFDHRQLLIWQDNNNGLFKSALKLLNHLIIDLDLSIYNSRLPPKERLSYLPDFVPLMYLPSIGDNANITLSFDEIQEARIVKRWRIITGEEHSRLEEGERKETAIFTANVISLARARLQEQKSAKFLSDLKQYTHEGNLSMVDRFLQAMDLIQYNITENVQSGQVDCNMAEVQIHSLREQICSICLTTDRDRDIVQKFKDKLNILSDLVHQNSKPLHIMIFAEEIKRWKSEVYIWYFSSKIFETHHKYQSLRLSAIPTGTQKAQSRLSLWFSRSDIDTKTNTPPVTYQKNAFGILNAHKVIYIKDDDDDESEEELNFNFVIDEIRSALKRSLSFFKIESFRYDTAEISARAIFRANCIRSDIFDDYHIFGSETIISTHYPELMPDFFSTTKLSPFFTK